RWASEKKLAELVDPTTNQLGGNGNDGNDGAEGPPEQRQPPGILKIFGGGLSLGANYKSVLATPRSSARQLVREALERYGLPAADG
ncbi:RAIN protein, partial [Urocolius indicus]|nr:RAIN protein [Urocolius indicus]